MDLERDGLMGNGWQIWLHFYYNPEVCGDTKHKGEHTRSNTARYYECCLSDVCRVTAAKHNAAFKHSDNVNIVALIASFHFPPHFPFTPSPRGSIRRERSKKEHQELSCV